MDIMSLVLVSALGCFLNTVSAVPGDCTFENGLCGYTQDGNDRFDWSNQTGKTPSRYTGPTQDHTNGSGTYMYIETSWPRLNKENALLISPAISDTIGNCLEFFYHMKGLNIRRLNVYTQESSGSRTLRWSLGGDQNSDQWSLARFALPSNRQNFKVVFEGISGTGYMGDIAIDDIKVYDAPSCHMEPQSVTSNCGIKSQITRIVGGTQALPGAWPWQAMLMYNSTNIWKQFCGGSLVTPEWVVTASHCVSGIRKDDYPNHRIRMGAHYRNKTTGVEQDLDIKRIYIHPDYNGYPVRYDYDIALIKLKKPAMIDTRTKCVCLPDQSLQFAAGSNCYITGWGTLKSGGHFPSTLQQAKVPLVSHNVCTKNGSYPTEEISDRMLCAGYPDVGGIDTCQGDSGGPLVCENNSKWYLVGITSWGYYCAEPQYPGIYAKVQRLSKWLANIIANQ